MSSETGGTSLSEIKKISAFEKTTADYIYDVCLNLQKEKKARTGLKILWSALRCG